MKTSVLFENAHYQACALPDGSLVVSRKRKRHGQRGIRLIGGEAPKWIEALKTADDADEANALCRALVSE